MYLPASVADSVNSRTARWMAPSTNLSVRTFLTDFSMAFLTALMSFLLTFFFAMQKPRDVSSALVFNAQLQSQLSMSGSRPLFQRILLWFFLFFLGGHVCVSSQTLEC